MSVIGIRPEEVLWCVNVESERQEDFNIGSFLQYAWVNRPGVLQLINADGIRSLVIAASVQRI